MSFIIRRLSPATMDVAQKKAQQLIDDNAVMVFSKSYCQYSRNTKSILDSFGAQYKAYELDQESDGDDIQSALQNMTGQRTVPNIFIGKKHIGGNSDLENVKNNGKDGQSLEEMLRSVNAIKA
ncbi:glutaredoxin-C2 [Diplogelasinospora grovesii]|uniref:Glutaredoxin-C2 n=1 Tax=Diplogelasinospora grovesii TaxID=303347 RepID=A0AAN6N5D4_9PEZI|nr:glutaredoxin-C2 [Diplogelasinospora grovesii]